MQGFIYIHRKIIDSTIYQMPPLYLRVFERLIMEANHKDNYIPFDGGKKLIKRGERITSIRQIAEWVGWYERDKFKIPNPKTISKILEFMVHEEMIMILSNTQKTHYKVLNYEDYQDKKSNKVTVRTSVSKQCVDTNNNVNNVNNNKDISSKKFSDDAQQILLSKILFEFIKQNHPKVKEPNLQSWANDIDKMMRIDNRTPEEIKQLIEWCQKDTFWHKNILSTRKLREKFDQLYLNMKNPDNKSPPKKEVWKDFPQTKYPKEFFEGLYRNLDKGG